MSATEPRGRITVSRYRWFWWMLASNAKFPPSKSELDRAKVWLESNHRSGAILVLRSIVENYPNTPAELQARELLKSLGE